MDKLLCFKKCLPVTEVGRAFFIALFLFCFIWVDAQVWTATWATAPEYINEGDMPKTSLSNNSIRQIVRVSMGGEKVRLWLTNQFSGEPIEIKSVYIADAADSSDIVSKSVKYLKFNGAKSVTLKAGEKLASDPIDFDLKALQRVAITIHYGSTPSHLTSHRGSRTRSYIIKGELKPRQKVQPQETLEHWYTILSLDVEGEGRDAVAVLGNSLTDGRGTTTDKQNRWTDQMATRLHELGVTQTGVLNLGIGGTCVYYGGENAGCRRFDRDILQQSHVKTIIIFEGVNDLGGARGDAEARCEQLKKTYCELAGKAHAQNVKIYIGTITPFGRSFYADPWRETARQVLNRWMREEAKCFDGVLDFDAVVRDEAKPDQLQERYSSDWLHLNAEGYEAIGRYAADQLADQIKPCK